MKKITALLLAIALVFSLCACGGSSAPAATEAPAATTEPAQEEKPADNAELVDGMRPEFKDAMDSYEAFYDEYCSFMKEYKENANDPTLIAKSADLVTKAAEVDEKFNAWDQNELNEKELSYYLEVSSRVLQKLSEVA